MSRRDDTSRFYELMDELSLRHGGSRLLRSSDSRVEWPRQGVYFFFEPGELRSNGRPRVVRVGTHALRPTSKTMLWTRLSQHRGRVGSRSSGGGNHRGSIFRLHVGAALINRGGVAGLPLEAWLAPDPMPEHSEAELMVERAVSEYIGRMPMLCVDVPTREDRTSDRGLIEATASPCFRQQPADSTLRHRGGLAATPRIPLFASVACGTCVTSRMITRRLPSRSLSST